MANITGNIVSSVQGSQLVASCLYNNFGKYRAQNQRAIAPYLSVHGLPSLNQPIMIEGARDASGTRLGTGQAVVMPPGVCFSFRVGYVCSLGFSFNIFLMPVNMAIRNNNWYYWFLPPKSPKYNYAVISQWNNGSVITADDAQFANSGNLTPAQRNYVSNSFQIRIEVWPMTEMITADGKQHLPVMAAPGAPPAVNTHHGTVGKGDKHDLNGTKTNKLKADPSQSTAIVFDILVMNQAFYNTNNVAFNV